jgi:uncharacterized protein (DUF58 family)
MAAAVPSETRSGSGDGEGVIRVGKRSLLRLKREGESLSLRAIRVRSSGGGAHLSRFKGRGMEFDEARPYQAGDEIRNIDWRITARTGRPHTKLFREEKERVVTLWVDYRTPMFFATRSRFKSVVATEAAAMIAWSARALGDRLGALLFSEHGHQELRPRHDDRGMLRLIGLLTEYAEPRTGSTTSAQRISAANDALARLCRVNRPGSLLLLLSDFRDLDEAAEHHLTLLARHNDLVLIRIFDPLETDLPLAGRYAVGDGSRLLAIDSASKPLRQRYRERSEAQLTRLTDLCRRQRMHLLHCATDDDLYRILRNDLGGVSR